MASQQDSLSDTLENILSTEFRCLPTNYVSLDLHQSTANMLQRVMRDFNAKVGDDNTGCETMMGKAGTSSMKQNNKRLKILYGRRTGDKGHIVPKYGNS